MCFITIAFAYCKRMLGVDYCCSIRQLSVFLYFSYQDVSANVAFLLSSGPRQLPCQHHITKHWPLSQCYISLNGLTNPDLQQLDCSALVLKACSNNQVFQQPLCQKTPSEPGREAKQGSCKAVNQVVVESD